MQNEPTPKNKTVVPRTIIVSVLSCVLYTITAFMIWDLVEILVSPSSATFQNQSLEMVRTILTVGTSAIGATLLLKIKKLGGILVFIVLGLVVLYAVEFHNSLLAILLPFPIAFLILLLYTNNLLIVNKNKHNLNEIIIGSVTKLKQEIEKHDITITTDLQNDVMLKCDMTRIDQLLTSLIVNAIEFSPKENGKIRIILKFDGKRAEITVEDNGFGNPKVLLDKIFIKFYQIDKFTKNEYDGTVFGLLTCRGIVESHGGKMWVELDEPGKIHISLPNRKHW